MAAAHAIKEALWLRALLHDLGMACGAVPIMADNQAAIKLLRNPIASQRSKHIDIRYHFGREHVARGNVQIKFVGTEKMLADGLTKALVKGKHQYMCQGLGLSLVENSH
jgi:proline dehydrogenase